MKKFTLLFTIFALIGAAFAVDAKVVSATGKVEMQEGGFWVPLEKGDTIQKGAVISTGFKSEAVIEFKGSKFTLGPLTRAKVEELLAESDKDTAELFIDSGKIIADVNGADGKRVGFKVRSPIATASVRGTQFGYTASGKLSVQRGLVSLASSNAKGDKGVPVAAGQLSQTNPVTGLCSNPADEFGKRKRAAKASSLNIRQKAETPAPQPTTGSVTVNIKS